MIEARTQMIMTDDLAMLVLTTRYPDRWRLIDTETDQEWQPWRQADGTFIWTPATDPRWWTTSDIAEFCGLTLGTISSYHTRGQMPEPVRKIGRTWVWKPETIKQWRQPIR